MKPSHLAVFALLAGFTVVAESDRSSSSGTHFRAVLAGPTEVPSNFTKGRAVFTAEAIEGETAIRFEMTYTDLSGPPTASHVHFAQKGVNGGISFYLCGSDPTRPAATLSCPPTTSGSFSGTVTAANVVGPGGQGIAAGDFAAILKMMRTGVTYANIHTAKHPPGEIRGQLKVVDESDSNRD